MAVDDWKESDWRNFYSHHLGLDESLFTTDELSRLYNAHYYRLDICGDNAKAREVLDSGWKSPLDEIQEKELTIASCGYVLEFGKDQKGMIFDPESITKETTDEYMKHPVVTVDFDARRVVGRVTSYKIDKRGVWVEYKLLAPTPEIRKIAAAMVPAMGGIIDVIEQGKPVKVRRLEQVSLVDPEQKIGLEKPEGENN